MQEKTRTMTLADSSNEVLSALPHTITILTRSGPRGGISSRAGLGLPVGPTRKAVVTITYVVAVFSILMQRLMLNRVLGAGASRLI